VSPALPGLGRVDQRRRTGGPAQPLDFLTLQHLLAPGVRVLGFYGLRALSAPSSFRRLAIPRGDQFFLKLQPFVGCHCALFALRRQIFYREINAFFRRRRCLSARVHWR
jgi:hypothetical protein